MTRTKNIYLALLAALLSPMAANADPITWTISDPVLQLLSGTFDYDADTGIYSAIAVIGSGFEDYSFGTVDVANSSSSQLSLDGISFPDSLLMVFDSALTNVGGVVAVAWYELSNDLKVDVQNFSFSGAVTISASGVAVPEPGTLALLGLGLVGMAARRRKTA